jgi:hypothetical protein
MCVIVKPRRNEEAQAHIGLSSHTKNINIIVSGTINVSAEVILVNSLKKPDEFRKL